MIPEPRFKAEIHSAQVTGEKMSLPFISATQLLQLCKRSEIPGGGEKTSAATVKCQIEFSFSRLKYTF